MANGETWVEVHTVLSSRSVEIHFIWVRSHDIWKKQSTVIRKNRSCSPSLWDMMTLQTRDAVDMTQKKKRWCMKWLSVPSQAHCPFLKGHSGLAQRGTVTKFEVLR